MKTILIIDADLGFVFWLGRALDAAGFETLPAKTVASGMTLIKELSTEVDVLIASPRIPGIAEFARKLHRRHAGLQVVALLARDEEEKSALDLPLLAAVKRKPPAVDESLRAEWVGLIRQVAGGSLVASGSV